MVAGVEISNKKIIAEAHKGGRGVTAAPTARRLVELSHVLRDGIVTLPGLVVRVPAGVRAIDPLLLAPYEVAGRAVLLQTGWDAHFGTPEYASPAHPYLTGDGARWLVEAGRGPGRYRFDQH
ncbi:cyclase family protein [Melissospora conviva]|uniref:cyclase family protein n=1 Tax=Melissospora conviva TaxID=3388432 RepID=UPI003F7E691D